MQEPTLETTATIIDVLLSIKPSDASNDHERRILEQFCQHLRENATRERMSSIDREHNVTQQMHRLYGSYLTVLQQLDDSEKLEGDRKSLKENLIRGIVALYPHLNSPGRNKFSNVLKASKNKVDGPQNRREGSASIHGAWGSRSPILGNRVGENVFYIRVSQLRLLNLTEIEISQHTGEYGALLFETFLTFINMVWNEDGCMNRNLNAVTGACTKRINTVCILIIDMDALRELHLQQGGIHLVLNSSWDQQVVSKIRSRNSWLPIASIEQFHYESNAEWCARCGLEPPRPRRQSTRRSSSSSTTHSGTTVDEDEVSEVEDEVERPQRSSRRSRRSSSSSSTTHSAQTVDEDEASEVEDEDEETRQIGSRVAAVEDGIRVEVGSRFPQVRLNQIKQRPQVFRSSFLCRSTIKTPTSRQSQIDDCLFHIDADLVQHHIRKVSTIDELIRVLLDLLNRFEILLDEIEPFQHQEFTFGNELHIILLELSININHAYVFEHERGATCFKYLWYAHEYKQLNGLNGQQYVVVATTNKVNARNNDDVLNRLDKWLGWTSGAIQSHSTTNFGRRIEPGTIEHTLATAIGICIDNQGEYFQARDAIRQNAVQKRQRLQREALAEDETARARSGAALGKLMPSW